MKPDTVYYTRYAVIAFTSIQFKFVFRFSFSFSIYFFFHVLFHFQFWSLLRIFDNNILIPFLHFHFSIHFSSSFFTCLASLVVITLLVAVNPHRSNSLLPDLASDFCFRFQITKTRLDPAWQTVAERAQELIAGWAEASERMVSERGSFCG